jgi:hypothetical protein
MASPLSYPSILKPMILSVYEVFLKEARTAGR